MKLEFFREVKYSPVNKPSPANGIPLFNNPFQSSLNTNNEKSKARGMMKKIAAQSLFKIRKILNLENFKYFKLITADPKLKFAIIYHRIELQITVNQLTFKGRQTPFSHQ